MNKGTLILLTLLVLPCASASLIISIGSDNGNSPSLSLNHGQSQTVQFTVNNFNDLCSLNCNWSFTNNDDGGLLSQGQTTASAKTPFYITQIFTAPTKEVAKKDSSTVQYTLAISCKDIKYSPLLCLSNEQMTAPQKSIITLSYDLTSQEKDAKKYLESQFSQITPLLSDIEGVTYTLNSKLSLLAKNILINDLKNKLDSYTSIFQNYNNNYDSTKKLYGALENTGYYNEAKNTLDSNIIPALTTLKNNVNQLDKDIDERVKLHNEVTDKLNQLKENLSKLEIKAKLLSKEVSDISSQVNSLNNEFESGLFTSYPYIQDKIISFNNQINSASISFDEEFLNILKQGNTLISLESAKLGKESKYNLPSTTNIEDIKNICNQILTIKSSFEKSNNEKTLEYEGLIKEVKEYNNNLEDINSKILQVNELRNKISNLVNKDNIKEKDVLGCQNQLATISNFSYEQLKNLTSNSYSACLELDKNLSEIREKKEGSVFFKIARFFRYLWPFESVEFEKINPLKVKESPENPNLLGFDEESETFNSQYCNVNLTISINSTSYVSNIEGEKITNSNVGGITEHENQCCSFNVCDKCCEGEECANDVYSYPIIFLHGHSFSEDKDPAYSLDAFNQIQNSLEQDKYRIGGVFLPTDQYSNMIQGEWGRVKFPITVKATYYYNVYNSEGKMINAPSMQESIDVYAQRLKTIVDLVKYRTGRNKVNIVSHSMGGIVARDYIKNYGGDSSVYKLIMIGTPNHGIYGQVDSFCNVLGANTECSQMKSDNQFMVLLNSVDETPGNVKYYTIAGSGCVLDKIDGDGISRVKSVELIGATNVLVTGKCGGLLNRDFHSNLLNPNKYPQTLTYIKQFLKE